MANIQLQNVVKQFNEIVAVNGINLEIEDGEFFCLLGPSGCGKTTTLRMIAGLEEQTSGDVIIEDDVVNDKRPRERDLAMVFQSNAVYPHLNVFENLAFPLKARDIEDDEIDRKVHEVAEILGIEAKLDSDPGELSGGQQQRVALGRAMIRSPRAFLMDEPLSDLDAKLRRHMRVEISELHDDLDTTVVYVTHDQIEAMTMADRIGLLRDGEVEQVGAPLDVYNEPETVWVGEFMGEPGMEFFDAETVDGGVAFGGEFTLDCDADVTAALPPAGSPVTVGVRPENMELAEEGIQSTVTAIEKVGDGVILHLEGDDVTYSAKIDPTREISVGDEVTVQFTERVHFFDEAGRIIARMTEGGPWSPRAGHAQEIYDD
jgi:multiple sugar transport system ATP-binding protein